MAFIFSNLSGEAELEQKFANPKYFAAVISYVQNLSPPKQNILSELCNRARTLIDAVCGKFLKGKLVTGEHCKLTSGKNKFIYH